MNTSDFFKSSLFLSGATDVITHPSGHKNNLATPLAVLPKKKSVLISIFSVFTYKQRRLSCR